MENTKNTHKSVRMAWLQALYAPCKTRKNLAAEITDTTEVSGPKTDFFSVQKIHASKRAKSKILKLATKTSLAKTELLVSMSTENHRFSIARFARDIARHPRCNNRSSQPLLRHLRITRVSGNSCCVARLLQQARCKNC